MLRTKTQIMLAGFFAALNACTGDDQSALQGLDAGDHKQPGLLDSGMKVGDASLDASLPNSPDTGDMCESRWVTFRAFVDSHRACAHDADCAIIGDCGPYAEFEAVDADVAKQARALQLETCGSGYDGPEYDAVCKAGRCERQLNERPGFGCPPIPDDAGTDDAGG